MIKIKGLLKIEILLSGSLLYQSKTGERYPFHIAKYCYTELFMIKLFK